MKKNKEKVTLIITTVCIGIVLLTNLIDYLSGDSSLGIVSSLCFAAAGILLIVAWVQYFRKKKKNS